MLKRHVVALHTRGNRLFLAISDPSNLQALDDVKFQTELIVDPIIVEDDKLDALLQKGTEAEDASLKNLMAEDASAIGDLLSGLGDDETEEAAGDVASAASDNELVKLVNKNHR